MIKSFPLFLFTFIFKNSKSNQIFNSLSIWCFTPTKMDYQLILITIFQWILNEIELFIIIFRSLLRLILNVSNNVDCNFLTWHLFGNHNFIITSWGSLNCFQVTLWAFWLKLHFKSFLEVHVLIDENLGSLLVSALSCS